MTTLAAARGKSAAGALVVATGGMATLSTVARTLSPGILSVVAIDRASDKPLYKQLYEGYRDARVVCQSSDAARHCWMASGVIQASQASSRGASTTVSTVTFMA